MTTPFVHLRLHTEYSLSDSLIRIKPLAAHLQEQAMPACAITDQTNFYGLIKYYKAMQGAGIKPIVGSDFFIMGADSEAKASLVTLLAMDDAGYKNIIKIISLAYQKGQQQGEAFVQREWITEHGEGVIVLSGGRIGDVGMDLLAGRKAQAKATAERWMAEFPGRYYLELQRTGREYEENYLHQAVELATDLQCPVVATNDVRFLSADDFEVHEARVCIAEGRALDDPRRERRYSDQQYLRSGEEMQELFSDIPEALANSVEIAKRCNVNIHLGEYFLPQYPIPEGLTENQFFEKVCHDGLEARLEKILAADDPERDSKRALYLDRLRFELDIILQMGFPGYFLIVMDFIQWAKDNAIPVGPGRGSGAGSLVAYSLKITDLDPLQYDLLFERFLNPERVSMPDFDVDFCMENRDRVISYVADAYGREAVSQIITFGTMAAKAVVRDVARVLGKSYGLADKLSKLIPPTPGMTLKAALEEVEQLREMLETDADAQEIWEMAVKLEGLTRNVGKHAGGVVIAPNKLTDFSPLYCDENGKGLVTQYDKNDVEEAGLVKFDFLGLRTLTIIDWAMEMINAQRGKQDLPPLIIEEIDLQDAETFKLLKRAETTAVFQLESRGMKDLIKRLKPDNLEDMIALVALFRPGPLDSGMVTDFVNRKHGKAEVAYPDAKYQHEFLEPILKPTYGVIVYQEQVMQIAQELAGYSLGGADLLRRAMGKKKPEEMAKQRVSFEEGAKSKGIDATLAMKIFDLVEKFAGYGFNKSHSAAYALVSYQTAWLKTHYPAHFMAATMSSDMDKTDKVVTFIEECRNMGLTLLPPDVNRGELKFTVDDDNNIIYGLGAIKGLGEGPVDSIIAARSEGGPFKDLFDFCARVDARKVNKRALEAVIRSGAADNLGPGRGLDQDRAVMFAAITEAVKTAEQSAANANAGMTDLFGEVIPTSQSLEDTYSEFTRVRPWSMKERLQAENETLGLYLTGHPIDEYEQEINHLVSTRISNLAADKNAQRVGGLVVATRTMKTKRGDTMAFITLDDRTGRIEIAVFSDTFNECRELLVKDALLVIEGQAKFDDYSNALKMSADSVKPLAEVRQDKARALKLVLNAGDLNNSLGQTLQQCLEPYRDGRCPIIIDYHRSDAKCQIVLGGEWSVRPEDELLQRLRDDFGAGSVKLQYA
ncbi:DNA polymerase III subunit alpha [Gilvimarinus sp. SDUM040013]|uniref:DNA polymerase III subunit alpha n=1 Tax=Gilvimarinus gilvus TaxID=3058038 RepID=A0ABU4S0H7_9GAMM|nr:DNA polymerase III subunit alpha [Gilvimarinus sp. SDUM040013]MDO3385778.1 DNA polymerase III subunit alpha [Gilvimarinus sp. SDUM040013]MDX6850660.1 DNA polymerase III subunit alpha [Gilvimarinus sp. SDUM040013]